MSVRRLHRIFEGDEPENQLAAKACYVLPWILHHACQWLSNGQNPALKQSTAFLRGVFWERHERHGATSKSPSLRAVS